MKSSFRLINAFACFYFLAKVLQLSIVQHVRFSVFPPFVEKFDNKSDNSKSGNNNPSEIIHVENEKTKKDAKSEKVKKQESNTNLSEPKKATSVPRKSSTQSRSGHIMDEKEPMTTASRKREFRRSISSDSSLSSRPSSGTRETVAEKILRHHWPSITCVK